MIKNIIKGVFGGGSTGLERIASEWIQTDKEQAEAKAIMVKTLDPNGMMRRELSRRVALLYTLYIVVTLAMLLCESFGVGVEGISQATEKVTELFLPITGAFSAIVSASFGVNYANVKKG